MKILKVFLKFILDIIMVGAICALVLSFNGKKVFYDLLYSNMFKSVVIEETKTVVDENASTEKIEKILENAETEKLINDFIDSTMNDLASDEEVTTDIGDLFLDYIKENKEMFEKELDVTITDESLEKVKESPEYQDLINTYKESVQESKTKLSPKEKAALNVYNLIVSKTFTYILIGIIVICIILLALIDKSLYKWIQHLSINSITSGIMMLLTSIIVQGIVNASISDLEIEFSTKPLTNSSILVTGIGIVLLIIYVIINKLVKKEKPVEE